MFRDGTTKIGGTAAGRQTASWFFENARELFGVVSSEGVFLEVNPAWTTLTGWSQDELLGRPLLEFLHEDSKAPVIEMGARVRRDGDVPSRMQMRCKDGRWVWLEGYVRLGPNGEMMGMQRDVTDDYRRAEALRQASQTQTLLSETAGVGLWRFDPRDEKLYWSEAWTRMLADAGIHMSTPEEFARFCHPEDVGQVIAAMDATINQGLPALFDHRLRRADGRWITIRVHIRGERLEDGRYMVQGLSQDVSEVNEARSELERHNQRLRMALTAAGAAVVDVNFETRTVWTSPEFVARVGYELTYTQATRLCWPCLVAEDAPAVENAVRAWLEGKASEPL